MFKNKKNNDQLDIKKQDIKHIQKIMQDLQDTEKPEKRSLFNKIVSRNLSKNKVNEKTNELAQETEKGVPYEKEDFDFLLETLNEIQEENSMVEAVETKRDNKKSFSEMTSKAFIDEILVKETKKLEEEMNQKLSTNSLEHNKNFMEFKSNNEIDSKLELNDIQKKCDELVKSNEKFQRQISDLLTKNDTFSNQNKALLSQLNVVRDQLIQEEKKLDQIKKEKCDIQKTHKDEIVEINIRLKQLESLNFRLDQEHKVIAGKLNKSESRNKELTSQLKEAVDDNKVLMHENQEGQNIINSHDKVVNKLKNEIEKMSDQQKILNDDLSQKLERESSQSQEMIANLGKEKKKLEDHIKELESTNDRLKNDNQEARDKLTLLENDDNLKFKEIEQLKKDIAEATSASVKYSKELLNLKEEFNVNKKTEEELEKKNIELNTMLDEFKSSSQVFEKELEKTIYNYNKEFESREILEKTNKEMDYQINALIDQNKRLSETTKSYANEYGEIKKELKKSNLNLERQIVENEKLLQRSKDEIELNQALKNQLKETNESKEEAIKESESLNHLLKQTKENNNIENQKILALVNQEKNKCEQLNNELTTLKHHYQSQEAEREARIKKLEKVLAENKERVRKESLQRIEEKNNLLQTFNHEIESLRNKKNMSHHNANDNKAIISEKEDTKKDEYNMYQKYENLLSDELENKKSINLQKRVLTSYDSKNSFNIREKKHKANIIRIKR